MGQRMDDVPHVYGDDCLVVFDAGETPKHLYARFINIVKCPFGPKLPPNDRMFKLTQKVDAACAYGYDDGTWSIQCDLNAIPKQTHFNLASLVPSKAYFIGEFDGPITEGMVFTNQLTACNFDRGGKDGLAVITWTHQATELLAALNIQKSYDLFLELFPLADGKLVYKFCRIRDSMNIKILFEP